MTARRHARPMSEHERAQRIRQTADTCAEAVVLALAILAALTFLVAGYRP